MSILEVFPQKRPVRLGDRSWVVSELRIRDLARLQEYVETALPHPYAALREVLPTLEGRARKRAILKLRRDAAEWPPTYPDPITVVMFTSTIKGGCLFLMAVLGRDNDIDVRQALDLYEAMRPGDWDRLNRALWGVSDVEEFERLISDGAGSSGTKTDWPKVVAEVQEKTKLTLDQIGDLTIGQFNMLKTGRGRAKYTGEDWSHLSDEEVRRRLKEQHELLAEGEDGY